MIRKTFHSTFKKGGNTTANAFILRDDQLREMNDCRINDDGNAEKRTGFTEVNATATSADYVTAIHQYQDNYGNKVEYKICGNKLYYRNTAGTAWTELQDGLGNTKTFSLNKRASMFTWKEALYVSNGEEPAFKYGPETVYNKSSVYIVDSTNNKIVVFDNNGIELFSFGETGTGNGQFTNILKACIDNVNDLIYVGDAPVINGVSRFRISAFDFAGNFLRSKTDFFSMTYTTALDLDMVCDESGNIFAVALATFGPNIVSSVKKYDPYFTAGNTYSITTGTTIPVTTPKKCAIAYTSGYVFAGITGIDSIKKINSTTMALDSAFGSTGTGDGQFTNINGMACDNTADLLYVCDNSGANARIQVFNFTGTYQSKWSVPNVSSIDIDNAQSYAFYTTNTIAYRSSLTGTNQTAIETITSSDLSLAKDRTLTYNVFRDLGSPKTFSADLAYPATTLAGVELPATGNVTVVTTGSFANTGTILIESEQITYTGKTGTTFTGCTRGANSTTAAIHAVGKAVDGLAAIVGNPNGTYKYKVTFATAGGLESSGGIETSAITAVSQQIALTNIPVSVMDTSTHTGPVTKRYIYRAYSSDSGTTYGNYLYIAEISDNVSTAYDDNIANGSEDTDVVPTINTLVPTFKYLVQFKDCLFGAGDFNNPNFLYWTSSNDVLKDNNEDNWNIAQWMPVGEGEIGFITGLARLGDSLIVFKTNSIWRFNFSIDSATGLITPTQPYLISGEYGCVSHFAIDEVTIRSSGNIYNVLMFPDKEKGISVTNGIKCWSLMDDYWTDWNTLDKTLLGNCVGKFYNKRNEYWLSLTGFGDTTNTEVWVYSLSWDCFYKPFNRTICALARIENSSGVEQLWSGDFAGKVLIEDNGLNDYSSVSAVVAIDGYISTGWQNQGSPENNKIYDKIMIEYIEKGTGSFTVQWAVDGGSFITAQTATVTTTGTAGVRNKYIIKPVDTVNMRTLQGKSISIKIRNATASETFEIVGIGVECRIEKAYIP